MRELNGIQHLRGLKNFVSHQVVVVQLKPKKAWPNQQIPNTEEQRMKQGLQTQGFFRVSYLL